MSSKYLKFLFIILPNKSKKSKQPPPPTLVLTASLIHCVGHSPITSTHCKLYSSQNPCLSNLPQFFYQFFLLLLSKTFSYYTVKPVRITTLRTSHIFTSRPPILDGVHVPSIDNSRPVYRRQCSRLVPIEVPPSLVLQPSHHRRHPQ